MKRHHKIIIHLLFWFYMLNQFLYPFYVNSSSFKEPNYLTGTFVSLGFNILVFYAFYFSLPLLMKPRYKIISILAGAVLILVLAWFKNGMETIIWRDLFHSPELQKGTSNEMLYNSIRLSLITSIYALLIKFVIDWFDAQKLKTDLLTQNKASELALLRSQINPHFLFNTLNNIYSLVYQKSENAPEAVMKLSSIMRYMLYDATTDKVPLEKEIEYLQSFIELQKLRMKEKEFVELTVTGSPSGRTIAPMLLIPFVENAFKHGSKSGSPPGIVTQLEISPERIRFEVRNAIKPNATIQKDAAPGIGLHNIQRRLDLLYPDKHSLVITEDKDTFTVKLIIDNP
jgi:two-component system LytT family sensor kinase